MALWELLRELTCVCCKQANREAWPASGASSTRRLDLPVMQVSALPRTPLLCATRRPWRLFPAANAPPPCRANVFASKNECFRCREPKPAGLPDAPQTRAPGKEGEWMCNQCGASVFASKIECFRCNAAKGSKGAGDVKTEPGTRGSGRAGFGRAQCKFDPDEPLLPALAARKVPPCLPPACPMHAFSFLIVWVEVKPPVSKPQP